MKFKVGDKVKILSSAVDMGVRETDIGRVGVIKDADFLGQYILICMIKPWKVGERTHSWAVKVSHITPVIKVGEQLEFAFMGEVNYE